MQHYNECLFAIRNNQIIEVYRKVSRKTYDTSAGIVCIAERNIFDTYELATRELYRRLAKQQRRQEKEKQDYMQMEEQRNALIKQHPFLLDYPIGMLLPHELEDIIRLHTRQ